MTCTISQTMLQCGSLFPGLREQSAAFISHVVEATDFSGRASFVSLEFTRRASLQ